MSVCPGNIWLTDNLVKTVMNLRTAFSVGNARDPSRLCAK